MKDTGIFRSKWLIALHVLLWGLVFLLPYIGERPHNLPAPPLPETIFSRVYWIFLFYFNAFILVPRFFNRRRIAVYIFSLLGLLALFIFIENISFSPFGFREWHGHVLVPGETPPPPTLSQIFRSRVLFTSFPFFLIMAISTTYRTVSDRVKEDEANKERETAHLQSELTFLRSQINPHFIFNVLNSLVSLARKKSDLLEPSLIRLSGLLHYMLYVPDEKISLQREVDYIEDYIDLQQLRFGGAVRISTELLTDASAAQQLLEPMLLIPFVENAFKHGTEVLNDPFIRIRLEQKGTSLLFEVENKFHPAAQAPERSSGIGLSNVRRRLDLLYPGKYELQLSKRDNIHLAQLKISLA